MHGLVPDIRRFTNVCNIKKKNNNRIALFMGSNHVSEWYIGLTLHSCCIADKLRFNVDDDLDTSMVLTDM